MWTPPQEMGQTPDNIYIRVYPQEGRLKYLDCEGKYHLRVRDLMHGEQSRVVNLSSSLEKGKSAIRNLNCFFI